VVWTRQFISRVVSQTNEFFCGLLVEANVKKMACGVVVVEDGPCQLLPVAGFYVEGVHCLWLCVDVVLFVVCGGHFRRLMGVQVDTHFFHSHYVRL
jgi:hypothetical protein